MPYSLDSKRVVVTGGAGFIGSELVRQIAAKGAEVTVIDTLVNGKEENVADMLGEHVRLQKADVRDVSAMSDLLKGVDVVFHLACLGVRHSIHSPLENHEVNASGTLNLLQQAKENGIDRFVYVSSSEVYGTTEDMPITEESPVIPTTVYGASKLAGDCYTRAYWETYDFPTVVVRPFNSFGPRCHHEGDSGEVIPKFLLRAMAGKPLLVFGDGEQTRDFTFVSDTARAICMAGESDDAVGRTVNVGFGREITVNELARLVVEATGAVDTEIRHIEPRPGDVPRLWADTTFARDLLGYEPEVDLAQGISLLKEWYQAQGLTPEELLAEEIERNWEL